MPITGLDLQLPALFVQTTPSAPEFLTGGPFGPESSILTRSAIGHILNVRKGSKAD